MTTPTPGAAAQIEDLLSQAVTALATVTAALKTIATQVQALSDADAQAASAVQARLDKANAQIAELQAELAAAQNPPAPTPSKPQTLFGASLAKVAGETSYAQSLARTQKSFGPIGLARLYDNGAGPAALATALNQVKPTLAKGALVIGSCKFSITDAIAGKLNSVIDPVLQTFAGHAFCAWHEPEQNGAQVSAKVWDEFDEHDKAHFKMGAIEKVKHPEAARVGYTPRVTPEQHKALYQFLASRIAALKVDTQLITILTGFDLATRLPLYWNDGVSTKLGLDPYAGSVTQSAKQMSDPLIVVTNKVAPGIPVYYCETGQPVAATKAQQLTFLSSLSALDGQVAGVAYFNYADASYGHRIDTDTDLSAAYAKVIAS